MRIQLRVTELPQEPPVVERVKDELVEIHFGEALSITMSAEVAAGLGIELMGIELYTQEPVWRPEGSDGVS